MVKLKEFLENYLDRDVASLLYNCFTKGFRLEYTGPINHIMTNNLLSARQFCSETKDKLKSEIEIRPLFKNSDFPFTNFTYWLGAKI